MRSICFKETSCIVSCILYGNMHKSHNPPTENKLRKAEQVRIVTKCVKLNKMTHLYTCMGSMNRGSSGLM